METRDIGRHGCCGRKRFVAVGILEFFIERENSVQRAAPGGGGGKVPQESSLGLFVDSCLVGVKRICEWKRSSSGNTCMVDFIAKDVCGIPSVV